MIAGSLYGERRRSRRFDRDCSTPTRHWSRVRAFRYRADHEERAVYVAQGKIDIAGDSFEMGQLLVFRPGDEITITALTPSPRDAAGRRADGRAASHLVELRFQLARSGSSRPRPIGRPAASARCPDDNEFIPAAGAMIILTDLQQFLF